MLTVLTTNHLVAKTILTVTGTMLTVLRFLEFSQIGIFFLQCQVKRCFFYMSKKIMLFFVFNHSY